jgi:hypothetical protein
VNPSRPAFLITIDTEGDDLWSHPHEITTRNARWLPRFQQLCETYGFLPTYLTNYEMARCPVFRAFGQDVLRRGAGEIGMHLHAWNSPPLIPLTSDDFACAPYLIEYPRDVMFEKVDFMTRLLRETFETGISSHRAGRWGFDAVYAHILCECGYGVDCSVTPGVSWASHAGGIRGGPDFTSALRHPDILDRDDVCRAGDSGLLEVPMTVVPEGASCLDWLRPHCAPASLPGRVLNRLAPAVNWLQPNGRNRKRLLRLLDGIAARGEPYAEFTLHSSELMPGGSPRFRTAESIENLYRDLHVLFAAASRHLRGATLTAFAEEQLAAEVAAR